MRPFTIMTAEMLAAQRALEDQLLLCLMPVFRAPYRRDIPGYAVGSSYRGTNIGSILDIDLYFLQIPNQGSEGFYDWTDYDTYSQGAGEGITNFDHVRSLDPVLATLIESSVVALAAITDQPTWQWVRSGPGMAGVVFRVAAQHPQRGPMTLDITLTHRASEFGVDHAQRFHHYFTRVQSQHGTERALQLLSDIRLLKWLVEGEVLLGDGEEKARKVPGFLIEALFLSQAHPRTFFEIIQALHDHAWPETSAPPLSVAIQTVTEPLIESGKSLDEILTLATVGGYASLKRTAARRF